MQEVSNVEHYSGDACMRLIEESGLAVGFSLGNALKYVFRCAQKPGADPATDIRKATWYFNRTRDRLVDEHSDMTQMILKIMAEKIHPDPGSDLESAVNELEEAIRSWLKSDDEIEEIAEQLINAALADSE